MRELNMMRISEVLISGSCVKTVEMQPGKNMDRMYAKRRPNSKLHIQQEWNNEVDEMIYGTLFHSNIQTQKWNRNRYHGHIGCNETRNWRGIGKCELRESSLGRYQSRHSKGCLWEKAIKKKYIFFYSMSQEKKKNIVWKNAAIILRHEKSKCSKFIALTVYSYLNSIYKLGKKKRTISFWSDQRKSCFFKLVLNHGSQ